MFRDPKVMGPVLTILYVIPAMFFFKHNLRLLGELKRLMPNNKEQQSIKRTDVVINMYYKRISLDIYIRLYNFSRILSFILKTSWITRQEQGK